MNPQVQRQVRRPNTFLHFGLPFIGFMVVGSLGLSVFVQGRKDQIDARAFVDDTRAPAEQLRRKKFDIGEEHERLKLNLDIDSYYNKAIPKPGQSTRDL